MTSRVQVEKYAETAIEMFTEGRDNFTGAELAKRLYDNVGLPAGDGAISDVAKALPWLRSVLEEKGHVVITLSQIFFTKYRGAEFTKMTEIERERAVSECLPIGRGKAAVGIMRIAGNDDHRALLLWDTWHAIGRRQIAGRVQAEHAHLNLAADQGVLTPAQRQAIGIGIPTSLRAIAAG